MHTQSALGIFWRFIDPLDTSQSYQDEVDGITFYGHWRSKLPEKLCAEATLKKLWCDAEVEINERKWTSDEYNSYSIDIHILKWPDTAQWRQCVEKTLLWLIAKGAIISWCGDESCGPSIKNFDPLESTCNVYAAFSKNVGFKCNANLNEEYAYLSDEQLQMYKLYLNNLY